MPKNAFKVENKNMLKMHQNYFLVRTQLHKCGFPIVNQHKKCLYSFNKLNKQYYILFFKYLDAENDFSIKIIFPNVSCFQARDFAGIFA